MSYGFRLHWRVRDSYNNVTESWARKIHSAWLRIDEGLQYGEGQQSLPTCLEYRSQTGLSANELRCTLDNLENGTRLSYLYGVHDYHFIQGRIPRDDQYFAFNHTCEYMGNSSITKICGDWYKGWRVGMSDMRPLLERLK